MPSPALARILSVVTVFSLLAWAGGAGAEERERELGFPREGFSVRMGTGWAFSTPDESLLELRRGKASLWIRRDDSKRGEDIAARLREQGVRQQEEGKPAAQPEAWKVKGEGESFRITLDTSSQRHGFALVAQPMGRRLEVEWVLPANDADLGKHVESVLASLDVTPYANPRRHVDWHEGWSIDVPDGWKRLPSKDRTLFVSSDSPVLVLGIRKAGSEADALSTWRTVTGTPTETPGTTLGLSVGAWWVSGIGAQVEGLEVEQAAAAQRSFQPSADAGPRAAPPTPPELGEPESFQRADAPPVTFRVPKAWKVVPPSPGMRLAQYEVPGAEPAECVVFFFGAAMGGSLEANLERWKKQFAIDGAPSVKTEQVAPDVTATILDVSGRYVAETRPGSGVTLDKPGWRMLAAMVLTPGGALYLKLVGPGATLAPATPDFLAWVRSFRTKG